MYMAPPFLAYYAASTSNLTLLKDVVTQCTLYRQILQSNTTTPSAPYDGKLWEHIVGPQSADPGLWSTGNAWAAAGMTRVLATVIKAPVAWRDVFWRQSAIKTLTGYIQEILDGAMEAPPDDGLLRNYLNDTTWFGEISGSSLLASVAYRMAVIDPNEFGETYIGWADGIRATLGGDDASGVPHVSSNGTVAPSVNPLGWGDRNKFTSGSPEGQNFVVLMYAAWRDCVFVNLCSRSGGVGSREVD